jgi:AcrR family transcriptional regulator
MATEASRTRRLPAAERRDLILSGAMQAFAEYGYHDASMAEIARTAGITPAVIYDHFASKQELHEVLLETQTNALLVFVAESLVNASEDKAQRMRTGIDAFFAFVESHPFAWRIIFRDAPGDLEIAEVHAAMSKRATDAITLFISASAPEELASEGDREQTIEMYGHLLKHSLNGLAAWWYEHRDVPREAVVERVMEFCWIGLQQLATPEEGS